MRILHVTWEYPPVLYGGLGRHVAALATAQAAAGHDVRVLTQHGTDGDRTADVEQIDGVSVWRAREPGAGEARTLDNLLPWVDSMQRAMARRAAGVLDDWHPHVVHGHDWVVADAASRAASLAATPLVVTVHATEAGRHQGWIVGPLSHEIHARERAMVGRADSVIVCSEAMRAEVRAALGGEQPISVVPGGVDLAEWSSTPRERAAARAAYGVSDDDHLLAFSGRLVWEKGLQTLLEALPLIQRDAPPTRLVVAGRGPWESELREIASGFGVADTTDFAGFVPEEQLRPLVAAADVAVVPSRYEPFGLVAVEAAALGTAVVASDVGGLADVVVNGRTGLLVPPGNAKELADAVTSLLVDPALANRLARAARRRAATTYAWPVLAAATIDAYRTTSRTVTARPRRRTIPDMNVITGEVVTY